MIKEGLAEAMPLHVILTCAHMLMLQLRILVPIPSSCMIPGMSLPLPFQTKFPQTHEDPIGPSLMRCVMKSQLHIVCNILERIVQAQ